MSATSSGCQRGRATRAMKNATGTPMTRHRIVTPMAMPRVRSIVWRYAGVVKTSTKFSKVNVRTSAPVKPSTVQKAVRKSAAREPR